MAPKIALCIQGGGARGAYAAGVLRELLREDFKADEVYGTSAGALLGVDFVTGDEERLLKMVTVLSDAHGFIRPSNYWKKGSIFDFHYLLEEMPKKQLLFQQEIFDHSPTNFFAVSTSVSSGKVAYFSKNDMDFLAGLSSSASLPPYSHPIEIGGDGYLDGGVVEPIPFHRALEENVPYIVVISTRAKGYRKSPMSTLNRRLGKRSYHNHPEFLEAYLQTSITYNHHCDEMDRLAEAGRIFVIYPSVPPKVSVTCQNRKKLLDLCQAGEDDAKNQEIALRTYLSK